MSAAAKGAGVSAAGRQAAGSAEIHLQGGEPVPGQISSAKSVCRRRVPRFRPGERGATNQTLKLVSDHGLWSLVVHENPIMGASDMLGVSNRAADPAVTDTTQPLSSLG